MFHQTDIRLKDWVEGILGSTQVSLDAPGKAESGQGISLYLLELTAAPPPRTTRRPPSQLALRYLVTSWADDPEQAHRLLGELVFAALESADLEVDLTPVPAESWRAFGTMPRPSFFLSVTVRRDRPEPETSLVLQPLVIQAAPVTSLHGVVLGPDDVPLAGARVEIPALRRFSNTDSRGRFSFANVPGQPVSNKLFVRARGRELNVSVEQPTSSSDPVVVRFETFEPKEE